MTEETADLHVRLPVAVKLQMQSAKGARGLTYAEYIERLVELHQHMLHGGIQDEMARLSAIGLEAVKT